MNAKSRFIAVIIEKCKSIGIYLFLKNRCNGIIFFSKLNNYNVNIFTLKKLFDCRVIVIFHILLEYSPNVWACSTITAVINFYSCTYAYICKFFCSHMSRQEMSTACKFNKRFSQNEYFYNDKHEAKR